MMHARAAAFSVALCAAASTMAAGSAAAASPPPGWTNERILTCDGTTVVTTYLTPAGFGSSFHVVASTDIIKPKHVEVVFPDDPDQERVVTVDVPGFDANRHDTVHCSYTDPAGLRVFFDGIRT
jgi:hypothetical protein